MSIFGLRSRASARGVIPANALTQALKTQAEGAPTEQDKDKDQPAASDDEYERDQNGDIVKDENGNPVKKTPAASDEEEPPAAKVTPPAAGLTGNARVKAILGHPAATAQRPLAEYLALDTEIDAVACSEILGKVTAVAAPAKPAATGGAAFLDAMKATGNPKVPAASAAAPAAGSEAEAVASMSAVLKKMGLAK